MLAANWENHVVDKLAIFEKQPAFWKLMVRIRKILCAKMVCRIVVVDKFLAFWFVFVIFPLMVDLAPEVRFRQFWYFPESLRCLLSNGTNLVMF